MNIENRERVIVFDTTLRDGEQSPGASMNLEEKIMIAEALDKMGVDIIEAGFARASAGDFSAIEAVAKTVKNATVCSLARAIPEDIHVAADAIKHAARKRIHTFISTSPLHMQYKLKMQPSQVLEAITESVSLAHRLVGEVEWSCEDGSRSEHDFLCKAIETAIKAGATTINIPDTVGYAIPEEYAELIRMVKNRVPNIDKAIISVHCHNDLGLAVANTLAAVQAGARQVECTINGLGERAGNAAMEEIVMAFKVRGNSMPFYTNVKSEHITKVSRLVSTVTGFQVQNNKAIVGANAFAHESGIHQHGMLAHAETYEIMTPESVGLHKSSLVLGKHSGRAALKAKLEEMGFNLGDNALNDAFDRFKQLADRKKEVFDEDLAALVDPLAHSDSAQYRLVYLEVEAVMNGKSEAEMVINIDGEDKRITAPGVGAVDATFNAIKKLIPHEAKLKLYQVHAVTQGTDAQAEVTIRLDDGERVYNGHAADMDTLVASAIGYINALNNMATVKGRKVAEYSQSEVGG
jgi:2-isopropylmalate synthase